MAEARKLVNILSRNSKTTKSLEIMTSQGIRSFLLFIDTFRIKSVWKQ